MKAAERAYIAGFFDGEGPVYLRKESYRSQTYRYLTITIYNTDKSILEWIRAKNKGIKIQDKKGG